MKIPTFVLRRLYVPGTLRREGEGLAFTLRNGMATATLVELRALRLDGEPVAPERVRVRIGDREVEVAEVTTVAPLVFGRGEQAEVRVRGIAIAGHARVRLEAVSAEFGELVIEFDDQPAEP